MRAINFGGKVAVLCIPAFQIDGKLLHSDANQMLKRKARIIPQRFVQAFVPALMVPMTAADVPIGPELCLC